MTPEVTPPEAPQPMVRTWVLWLLLMVLFSLVVSFLVGILKSFSGAGLAEAVLAGGTAFGATVATCLTSVIAVKELRKSR